MSIFDLLFLLIVLGSIATLILALIATLRRRWPLARRSALILIAIWVFYLGAGTLLAVATPQKTIAIGQDRCFDEMCFAVPSVHRAPAIGTTQASGIFQVVTIRISSQSRGRVQHESGRIATILDQSGTTYLPSPIGTQAFATINGPQPSLESDLDPAQTLTTNVVFDIPTTAPHPALALSSNLTFYPPRLILGDPMHFLHKPTITPLD